MFPLCIGIMKERDKAGKLKIDVCNINGQLSKTIDRD